MPCKESPDAWRICAVVVSFHPDGGLAGRLARIAAQVEGVVLVDNGSGTGGLLQDVLADLAGARVVCIGNASNIGVAAALNQGIEYARLQGYTHALLFDQDTDPLPHMVRTLRDLAARWDDLERVAVIGSNFLDAGTGRPGFRRAAAGTTGSEVTAVITSGSLLRLDLAGALGPFREDFFIDLVDDEYCLRARSHGYKVLLVHEPLSVHALGRPKVRRLPWGTIGTSNHPAERRYYMIRNYVIVVKTYGVHEPAWVLETAYVRLKTVVLLLAFDDDRAAKLHMMWRGLLDGLANRTGALRGPQAPTAPRS